jgi:hypothetical protein
LPHLELIGAGLGQCSCRQAADGRLPFGQVASHFGSRVVPQEPAQRAKPPLPLEDRPLPRQHLLIALTIGNPDPRCGREESIEMESKVVGHGQLLSFCQPGGGEVEIARIASACS